ncbi:hypothetical protein PV08_10122 [Exophiala spinifera]|uniref:L-ascorbate oxidase n=1 Tax=Exophiala spinifera TaxID=91928 RepID=A0A0D2AVQ6_9EURO|nr:uncharacterized protein PV08_10122 [Exophiala spinifera]KIW10823.1 hypothetical protein PV08_10122 [Exophiala spinifera]
MRILGVSGFLALGLSANALAENWNDWTSPCTTSTAMTTSSSRTVDPISQSATKTFHVEKVSPATATVTKTETTTVWKATTTVYHSTIFIGPGFCATTTVTVDGSGRPFPPLNPASTQAASQTGSYAVDPVAGSPATSTFVVDPVNTDAGSQGPVTRTYTSIVETTIGTDGEVFTWTGEPPSSIATQAAPTYTNFPNGSWPEPGSPASNVSAPNGPITGGSQCNTAADRSVWCNGLSINDDTSVKDVSTGNTCSYDFTITNTTIDFDGSGPKLAFAINGQVPGPLIECNWGDLLVVTVHNQLTANSTSIHWHGLWQRGTNDQDGVPGITECGLAPGTSRTYTMQLNQYGTGWYHAHTMTQYADGIRGPMVIHGPATSNYDIDMGTVMIDDTFADTAAQQNERNSHIGPSGTQNYLLNGKNTMPDLSAGQHALWKVQSGKKHLFRLINSAAQNVWSVHFDDHTMTVIAIDYVPIVPYETEWLNIGIGQRYDVIVEMNQPKAGYFLRAVTQTGCPSSSVNTGLGAANGILLYDDVDPILPTSTYGDKTLADFASCLDEPIASLVPFVKKSAGSSSAFAASVSTLPAGNVARIAASDGGSVFRWYINSNAIHVNYSQPTLETLYENGYGVGGNGSSSNTNATTATTNGTSSSVSPSDLISNSITLTAKNTWVYFVIQNQFFAAHPMHLHGHDFSILGQGSTAWTADLASTLNFDNPPRRDTAMLIGSEGPTKASGYTVIGFETDNPGAWLMHCHIVWHVDGGLALQWIERPDDIKPYAASDEFQSECDSLTDWQRSNPLGIPSSWQSGLRKRVYLDDAAGGVVRRRSESSPRDFLASSFRRRIGDGFKLRHGHGGL